MKLITVPTPFLFLPSVGSAPPPFDPATDSQINTRWLAADSILDPTYVSSVPADKDGSGCGALDNNQAWKRPVLITIGGKTAWEFGNHDAAKNDLLRCGTWSTPRSALMTYVILDGTTIDAATRYIIDGGATGVGRFGLAKTTSTILTMEWNGTAMATGTIPSGVFVVCCCYDGTSNFMQINGSRATDSTDVSTASFDDIMVGCRYDEAARSNASIFEVGFAIAGADSYETIADNLYTYAQTEYGAI